MSISLIHLIKLPFLPIRQHICCILNLWYDSSNVSLLVFKIPKIPACLVAVIFLYYFIYRNNILYYFLLYIPWVSGGRLTVFYDRGGRLNLKNQHFLVRLICVNNLPWMCGVHDWISFYVLGLSHPLNIHLNLLAAL